MGYIRLFWTKENEGGIGYESLEGRMGDLQDEIVEEEPKTHVIGKPLLRTHELFLKTHIDEKITELINI